MNAMDMIKHNLIVDCRLHAANGGLGSYQLSSNGPCPCLHEIRLSNTICIGFARVRMVQLGHTACMNGRSLVIPALLVILILLGFSGELASGGNAVGFNKTTTHETHPTHVVRMQKSVFKRLLLLLLQAPCSQKRGLASRNLSGVDVDSVLEAAAEWWTNSSRLKLCNALHLMTTPAVPIELVGLAGFRPVRSAARIAGCSESAENSCVEAKAALITRAVPLLALMSSSNELGCQAALTLPVGLSAFEMAREAMQRNASCAMFAVEKLVLAAAQPNDPCTASISTRILAAAHTPTLVQIQEWWRQHRAGNTTSSAVARHMPHIAAHTALLTNSDVPYEQPAIMQQAQRELAFLQLEPHCDHRSRVHIRAMQSIAAADGQCRAIAQAVDQSGFDFFVASATCTKLVCKRALEVFFSNARLQPMCMLDARIFAASDSICHTADNQPCLYTLAAMDTFTNLKEEYSVQLWSMGPYTEHKGASVSSLTTVIGQHGGVRPILDLACSQQCYTQQLNYLHSLSVLTDAYSHTARGAHGLCSRSAQYKNSYCLVEEGVFNLVPPPRHLLFKTQAGGWHPAPFPPGQATAAAVAALLGDGSLPPPALPLQLQSNPELALFELFGFVADSGTRKFACSSCGRQRAATLLAASEAARIHRVHEAERFASVSVVRASLLAAFMQSDANSFGEGFEVHLSADDDGLPPLDTLVEPLLGTEAFALSVLQGMQLASLTATRSLWGQATLKAMSLLDDVLCSGFDFDQPQPLPCAAQLRDMLRLQILDKMGPRGMLPPRTCSPDDFMQCSGLDILLRTGANGSAPLCSACGMHLARWAASAHMVLLREATDAALTTLTHRVCLAFRSLPWDLVRFSDHAAAAIADQAAFCDARDELVLQANRHQRTPAEFADTVSQAVQLHCDELADPGQAAISAAVGVELPALDVTASTMYGVSCVVPFVFRGINIASLPSTAFRVLLEDAIASDVVSMTGFDFDQVLARFVLGAGGGVTPMPQTAQTLGADDGDNDYLNHSFDVDVFLHASTRSACRTRQAAAEAAASGWRLNLHHVSQTAELWQTQGWWSREMGNGTLSLASRPPPPAPQPPPLPQGLPAVAVGLLAAAGCVCVAGGGFALRSHLRNLKRRRVFVQ